MFDKSKRVSRLVPFSVSWRAVGIEPEYNLSLFQLVIVYSFKRAWSFFSIEVTRMDFFYVHLKQNFYVFRFILISQSTTGAFIVSYLSVDKAVNSYNGCAWVEVDSVFILRRCGTLKWPIPLRVGWSSTWQKTGISKESFYLTLLDVCNNLY